MSRIFPNYSKNRVNGAGQNIRNGNFSPEDVAVVENWRASHAHVLNTFQTNLRRKTANQSIVVAQRLKRRETIFNKLIRQPGMQLARMQDIAGCRLIFSTLEHLSAFREAFNTSRMTHVRKYADDDRYNYIDAPKQTGYRGIHDVFEYQSAKRSGAPWQGLNVEIQYRTVHQHAWATAVEVAGLLTKNRPKFNEAEEPFMEYFRLASEIIARVWEERNSCKPELSDEDLCHRFMEIDEETRISNLFEGVNSTSEISEFFRPNTILIFTREEGWGEFRTDAISFDSVNAAIVEYNKLEEEGDPTRDVVLVRADDFEMIKFSFKNYFADTRDFLTYVRDGIGLLLDIDAQLLR